MTTTILAFPAQPRRSDLGWDVDATLRLAGDLRGAYAEALAATRAHFFRPASRQLDDSRARFDELRRAWKSATATSSLVRDRAMHPAYQMIVGMGASALPLILEELEREPDHWFWALKAITGLDPVAPEHRGDIAAMTAAWLELGRRQRWIR